MSDELEQQLKAGNAAMMNALSSKNNGVVIVTFYSPRLDWRERFEFCLMQYKGGNQPDLDGKFAFPGGGVEVGETLAEAAQREFAEETGLKLDAARFKPFGAQSTHTRPENSNRIATHGKIFRMNYFVVRLSHHEQPKCTEPEKHSAWGYWNVLELPRPLTESTEIAVGRFLSWNLELL